MLLGCVGVAAWVFTVLLAAGMAFVALSIVGRKAVFNKLRTLAVWASDGDGLGDGHYSFYPEPLPILT